MCQDGSDYPPCKDDGDCSAGHCVYPPAGLNTDVPVGWCSNGALMEPCAGTSDCQNGYCYAAPDAVGLCFGGELGDPCIDPSQCKSAICVRLDPTLDGTCQSGVDPALCASNDDCLNHMCIMRPPDQPVGVGRDHQCNAGTAGLFCWTDADCLSQSCVPVPGKGPGRRLRGTLGAVQETARERCRRGKRNSCPCARPEGRTRPRRTSLVGTRRR